MTGHPWYEDDGVVAARQLGMDVPYADAGCTLRRGRRDAISANERKRVRLVNLNVLITTPRGGRGKKVGGTV